MLGVLVATQQQAVTPDAAARPDAVAALPMCHRSLGNAYAWTAVRGGIATTGFTAKRSTRRLRRCPT